MARANINDSLVRVLLFGILLTPGACVSVETINGPDGTPHQLVSCHGIKRCYEKATEVCGGKYQIVNTSTQISGNAQATDSTTDLLVKCEN